MTRLAWQLLGIALFGFIPVVLVLFVRHPEPVGLSLAAGILLMIGHRFLARPYYERVRPLKCAWCNRLSDLPGTGLVPAVEVAAASRTESLLACPHHVAHVRRFFACLDRLRLPLRLGIGLPLLLLLGALTATAFGRAIPIDRATALFQLVVGATVNVAAWGYLAAAPVATARAAFPIHNFLLMGIRAILWIFRAVGIWWIWIGARTLFGPAGG